MTQWPGSSYEDLLRWAHFPARPQSDEVEMTAADTEYSWDIPKGTREFALILQDQSVAWRFSARSGDVDNAGGGTPRSAGQSISYKNGFYTGTVYFASSSASQVMRIEYSRIGV